jgi:hypothetical protein
MVSVDVKERLREWLVRLFTQAIGKVSNEDDRRDIATWLSQCRDVLDSDRTKTEKMKELYALTDAKKSVVVMARSVGETVKNYKNADLPLAVKLAIPVTLLAVPVIGWQGAGITALGSALGLPVLAIVFIGTAGITAVLESFTTHKDSLPYVMSILELIAREEIARRASAELKEAMRAEPAPAKRFSMPAEEARLREKLLNMNPYDFEAHVVSFFKIDGQLAWTTRKSNDLGVDGFAERPEGLVVIQCKRNAPDNPVGGPLIQQFKGVIEENGAAKGYFVTTSTFTAAARESAAKSDKLTLVDMDELVAWHASPPFATS